MAKKFHIGVLLSAVTGAGFARNGLAEMQEFVEYMKDKPVYHMKFPRRLPIAGILFFLSTLH